MDPSQSVQVIVQYNPSLLGGLLSTVCGVLNLIQLLPAGELCSMTVSSAMGLAQNPSVAHVSVNNAVRGAGSALPVYDYMPQTIQPQSGGGSPIRTPARTSASPSSTVESTSIRI